METNRLEQVERKLNISKTEKEEDKVFIKFWADRMKELVNKILLLCNY